MFYATHESNQCGSDWTIILRGYKTVRGAIRNLQNSQYLHPGKWTLRVCGDNGEFYQDSACHRVVGEYTKAAR